MQKITLQTLSTATPQEVFDQVVSHLNSQEFWILSYRDDDVPGCALGCLISDQEWSQIGDMNNYAPWSYLLIQNLVPPDHFILLTDLQYLNDRYCPNDRTDVLVEYARLNSLETTAIK
jgi:hypothetical protein